MSNIWDSGLPDALRVRRRVPHQILTISLSQNHEANQIFLVLVVLLLLEALDDDEEDEDE